MVESAADQGEEEDTGALVVSNVEKTVISLATALMVAVQDEGEEEEEEECTAAALDREGAELDPAGNQLMKLYCCRINILY